MRARRRARRKETISRQKRQERGSLTLLGEVKKKENSPATQKRDQRGATAQFGVPLVLLKQRFNTIDKYRSLAMRQSLGSFYVVLATNIIDGLCCVFGIPDTKISKA